MPRKTPTPRLGAGDVEQAVLRDVKRLPTDLAESSLAATAIALARSIDYFDTSATARSMCAKALLDIRNRLFDLAPEEPHRDQLDELATRRAARRSAASDQ